MSVFVLSPVLKTLTDSISTDTIYAMTVSSCYIDLLLKGFTCAKKMLANTDYYFPSVALWILLFFCCKKWRSCRPTQRVFLFISYYLNWLLSRRPVLPFSFRLLQAWQHIWQSQPSVFSFSFLSFFIIFFNFGEKWESSRNTCIASDSEHTPREGNVSFKSCFCTRILLARFSLSAIRRLLTDWFSIPYHFS